MVPTATLRYGLLLLCGGLWAADPWEEPPGAQPYGEPEVAFEAAPTLGAAPLHVTFTDRSVGSIETRSWDFDHDGVVDSTGASASHTYRRPGLYSVTLSVTGPLGDAARTVRDCVRVVAPLAIASDPWPAAHALQPYRVQLRAAGGLGPLTWSGNGLGALGLTLDGESGAISGVIADAAGDFPITVHVTDHSSQAAEAHLTLTVRKALVAGFVGGPTRGVAPLRVTFADTSRGDITRWAWDFDDDGRIDLTYEDPRREVQWSYAVPGHYDVVLTIYDDTGQQRVRARRSYVHVTEPPRWATRAL